VNTETNITPSNTIDNSIGQVVPFNDPYQEPTDLITAQAGGGQEGQMTPNYPLFEGESFGADWEVHVDKITHQKQDFKVKGKDYPSQAERKALSLAKKKKSGWKNYPEGAGFAESKYDALHARRTGWGAESFSAEQKLKRKSCCCGATKSHPCACMIQGIMECSATCPCSLEKKSAESFGAEEFGADDEELYDTHGRYRGFGWGHDPNEPAFPDFEHIYDYLKDLQDEIESLSDCTWDTMGDEGMNIASEFHDTMKGVKEQVAEWRFETIEYRGAESFSEAGLELRNAGRCGCEQDDLWEVVNVESPVFLCSTCGYAGNKKEDGHFMHMKNTWNAESKFKRPYDGRHGFDPKRDTKGRYRRKLVVPLAKGAEYEGGFYADDNNIYTHGKNVAGEFQVTQYTHKDTRQHENFVNFDMPISAFLKNNKKYITIERDAFSAESLVEEPDWIPAGDGRALGQQNLDINLSPLHAEGNLKDYNPITMLVLGLIGGIGVALGAQSLVK